MEILRNFKLDKWYGVVLFLGVAAIIASFSFKIDFIEAKYLFGFGFGFTLIGIGYIASEITKTEIWLGNFVSWPDNKHNAFTIGLISIGFLLTIVFGYKIIIGLL